MQAMRGILAGMKIFLTNVERSQFTRLNGLLLAVLLGLGTSLSAAKAKGAVYLDPVLRGQLTTLGLSRQVQAIVNFDPAVTSGAQLAGLIRNLGAGTITFNNLDSVGVRATPLLINGIARLPGVTGIYANRQLKYFMPEPNSFIGADAA